MGDASAASACGVGEGSASDVRRLSPAAGVDGKLTEKPAAPEGSTRARSSGRKAERS